MWLLRSQLRELRFHPFRPSAHSHCARVGSSPCTWHAGSPCSRCSSGTRFRLPWRRDMRRRRLVQHLVPDENQYRRIGACVARTTPPQRLDELSHRTVLRRPYRRHRFRCAPSTRSRNYGPQCNRLESGKFARPRLAQNRPTPVDSRSSRSIFHQAHFERVAA